MIRILKGSWKSLVEEREIEFDTENPIRLPIISSICIWPVLMVYLVVLGSMLSDYLPSPYFPMWMALAGLLTFVAMQSNGRKLRVLVVVSIVAFIVRLLVVLTYQIEPVSDFKSTYDVACRLAAAPVSDWAAVTHGTMYYDNWVFYMPFIVFEAVVVKVFGPSILSLQVVFAASTALTCFFTGLVAQKIGGYKAGIGAALLLAFNPTVILFTPVLSSQHVATLLFVVGVYFVINRPIRVAVLNDVAGLFFFALSHLFRPEMYVVLIALVCLYIVRAIGCWRENGKSKKFIVRRFVVSLGMLLVFFAVTVGTMTVLSATRLIKQSDIDHTGYKIAVGLNKESGGRYNKEDMLLTAQSDYDYWPLIGQRLSNKLELIRLISEKTVYQWAYYNYHWSYGAKDPLLTTFVPPAVNGYMFVVFVMGAVTLLLVYRRTKSGELFMVIVCLGYFLVFAVIEVQTRYNYILIPIFTILAAQLVPRLSRLWGR